MTAQLVAAADFEVPAGQIATMPPEVRGVARDGVRLLVADRVTGELTDTVFRDLPRHLDAGDVLVVNVSATLPAALDLGDGRVLHVGGRLPGDLWLVELRRVAGAGTAALDAGAPGGLALPGGGSAQLLSPWSRRPDGAARLWLATLQVPGRLHAYLAAHGQPVRYEYAARPWPLDAYQTVFATEPGSAEMPSAARGFTPELVTRLVSRGVQIVPLVLHTGLSSPEPGERPAPERYRVGAATAAAVNAAAAAGGRVIAVGTTATRALESVADESGRVHPGAGWTELVITPARGMRVVDGIITGWHEPRASHLDLLEAIGGDELVARSYATAVDAGYRWHEFGDLHLLR